MRIGFDDLFTGRGSDALAFSPRAEDLSGGDVEIRGFLVPLHAASPCASRSSTAGRLPGLRAGAGRRRPPAGLPRLRRAEAGSQPVRLRGRLSYGFAIADDGYASFLRLEDARVATGLAQAVRAG